MDLPEQLAAFDRHAGLAYERILQEIIDSQPEILALARERLIEGYDLYGGAGFGQSSADLARERLEEYADAVNYMVMSLEGGPPHIAPYSTE